MKIITLFAICGLMLACNKQTYSLQEQSQTFGQSVKYNNKVDIIMMVDNSSSMDTYQNRLADQVPGMVNSLNALGMDYHLVVVTTDMRTGGNGGMFVGNPKVLSRDTANLNTVLTSRIRQGNGGSDLERGLQSIQSVLTQGYLEGEGAGFLRADALLAVIALSNEDDYSSGTVDSYRQLFDQVKPKFNGTTRAWVVNFIGVPNLQSSCSTALDGTYKEPGARWIELAGLSQGLVQPICDTTLAAAVDNVRKRIVEIITDFPLKQKPKLDTVVVHINGQLIPQSNTNGWEYIPAGYLLRFHGTAVPGADDRISVDFTPAEAM
jgi:hypothetical protein